MFQLLPFYLYVCSNSLNVSVEQTAILYDEDTQPDYPESIVLRGDTITSGTNNNGTNNKKQRIIFGRNSEPNKYPWMAIMYRFKPGE